MKITRTYFMLMVSDMERAFAFWKALGPAQDFQSPDWSELQFAGGWVALHSGGTGGVETGLGLEVDDVEAACAAVEAAGGKVVKAPEDEDFIVLAIAADPDGNTFSLAQPKHPA